MVYFNPVAAILLPENTDGLQPNTVKFAEWLNGGELKSPEPLILKKAGPICRFINTPAVDVLSDEDQNAIRGEIFGLLYYSFPSLLPVPLKEPEKLWHGLTEDGTKIDKYSNSLAAMSWKVDQKLKKANIYVSPFVNPENKKIKFELVADCLASPATWPWFMFAVFLTSEDFHKVQKCPNCSQMFLRSHSRQRYCGPDCAKEWDADWRTTEEGKAVRSEQSKRSRKQKKKKKEKELLARPEAQRRLKAGALEEDVLKDMKNVNKRKGKSVN